MTSHLEEVPFVERRANVERRADCAAHEGRIDEIEGQLEKQSGYMKATGLVIGVSTAILLPIASWYLSGINSKLNSIESLLNASSSMINLHSEQIKNLQGEVKDINERHRYLDQNGVVKRVR